MTWSAIKWFSMMLGFGLGGSVLLGWLFGAPQLYSWTTLADATPMAVPTAVGFVLVAIHQLAAAMERTTPAEPHPCDMAAKRDYAKHVIACLLILTGTGLTLAGHTEALQLVLLVGVFYYGDAWRRSRSNGGGANGGKP